jgi:hypothetical protein
MPYIFYENLENNEAMVTKIVHIDDFATDEEKQAGKYFANIPQPEIQQGKLALLYINIETDELFYKYVDRPLTPEEKLQLLEQENEELKARIEVMQQALDELLLGGTQ